MEMYLYSNRKFTLDELKKGSELLETYGFKTRISMNKNGYDCYFGNLNTNLKAIVQLMKSRIQVEMPNEKSLIEFKKVNKKINRDFFQNILKKLIEEFDIKEYNSTLTYAGKTLEPYDLSNLKLKEP